MARSSESTFRIGQLANEVGKTVRTLHFYEELGLLSPAARSKGGFRLYDDSALDRIHWIERLQELGFSLTEIRDFLCEFHEHSHGPAAMNQLRTFYAEKVLETRAAIERLQGLESELQSSIAYLNVCETCCTVTPRTACITCAESDHADRQPPAMVAAIADVS